MVRISTLNAELEFHYPVLPLWSGAVCRVALNRLESGLGRLERR